MEQEDKKPIQGFFRIDKITYEHPKPLAVDEESNDPEIPYYIIAHGKFKKNNDDEYSKKRISIKCTIQKPEKSDIISFTGLIDAKPDANYNNYTIETSNAVNLTKKIQTLGNIEVLTKMLLKVEGIGNTRANKIIEILNTYNEEYSSLLDEILTDKNIKLKEEILDVLPKNTGLEIYELLKAEILENTHDNDAFNFQKYLATNNLIKLKADEEENNHNFENKHAFLTLNQWMKVYFKAKKEKLSRSIASDCIKKPYLLATLELGETTVSPILRFTTYQYFKSKKEKAITNEHLIVYIYQKVLAELTTTKDTILEFEDENEIETWFQNDVLFKPSKNKKTKKSENQNNDNYEENDDDKKHQEEKLKEGLFENLQNEIKQEDYTQDDILEQIKVLQSKRILDLKDNRLFKSLMKLEQFEDKIVISPKKYYIISNFINKQIKSRMKTPSIDISNNLDDAEISQKIAELVSEDSIHELDDSQMKAIVTALKNQISIITGGPGTGKTTILKYLIRFIQETKDLYQPSQDDFPIMLVAPTGKAAKRLRESVEDVVPVDKYGHQLRNKRPALLSTTIHTKLMKANGSLENIIREKQSLYSHNTPFEDVEIVIIDESSMIDEKLFANFIRLLPQSAKIVLVGDVDQLPSIAPGRLFKDLIESKIIPVSRLSTIHRAEDTLAKIYKIIRNQGTLEDIQKEDRESQKENVLVTKHIPTMNISNIMPWLKWIATEIQNLNNNITAFNKTLILSPESRKTQGVTTNTINWYVQHFLKQNEEPFKNSNLKYKIKLDDDASNYLNLYDELEKRVESHNNKNQYRPIDDYSNVVATGPTRNGSDNSTARDLIFNNDYVINNRNAHVYEFGEWLNPEAFNMADYNLYTRPDIITTVKNAIYNTKDLKDPNGYIVNGQKAIIIDIIKLKDKSNDTLTHNIVVLYTDEDKIIALYDDSIQNLKLAYALSVHKSQGSEAENVLFLQPYVTSKLNNKELVYTAITRAKKRVTIIGNLPIAFNKAMTKTENRKTILLNLLKEP